MRELVDGPDFSVGWVVSMGQEVGGKTNRAPVMTYRQTGTLFGSLA